MGSLKVEIDYSDVASTIMAARNGAKQMIAMCDKVERIFDEAQIDYKHKEDQDANKD